MVVFLQDNLIDSQSVMQKAQSSPVLKPITVESRRITQLDEIVTRSIKRPPEIVIASFYGGEAGKGDFHGKETASGKTFDKKDPTMAAHRELPFGTKLTLKTDLESLDKTVVVIEDRGPFAKDRHLDVSRAAAKKLGFVEDGVVPLFVTKIILPPDSDISLKEAYALLDSPYPSS
jgi:rare lipoprotein A (peptidoglycan hydrolase)